MYVGGLGALVMLVALASLVLVVLALADLAKRPAWVWEESGQNQLIWLLIVIFFAVVIGPALYLAIARPALNEAADRLASDDVTL